MMNKTSKALKKLLCAALITGIVLTGFPATLWHSAYGNITHAEAAETTEEQWKTDIKNALDKVTEFDDDKYAGKSIYLVDLSTYNIPKADIDIVNKYLTGLKDTADYYWVNYIIADSYGTAYVKYVFYSVKSEYIDSASKNIDKAKAKTDYETFHKRLENGEQFVMVKERVQAAIDNKLHIEYYQNGKAYYWTGFYVTDLGIPYSKMGELLEYLNGTVINDESCSWCTYTLQYDTNMQYITYVQLDANEAVVDKNSIETNETTGVPVRAKIDKAKVTSVYKDIKNRISSLTYAITDDMSDVEKVLLVHDWIARELDYDYDNYQKNSIPDTSYLAYGALTTSKAVCSGYARLANILLNGIGIRTQSITSSAMNHEWNAVYLNGHYYHMDITWDDWGKDENNEGTVYHEYFLYNDTDFKNVGDTKHHDWIGVVCDGTDSFADMIFRNKNSYINTIAYSYYNSYWYYINKGSLYKSRIDGSSLSVVEDTAKVTDMFVYGNNIYYATHSSEADSDVSSAFSTRVWKVNADNGTKSLYLNLSDNADYQDGVQEMCIKNGVLKIDGNTSSVKKELVLVEESIKYGDINGNGKIDSTDAVAIKKYLAGYSDTINKKAADVTGDGKIDVNDAIRLLKYLAGYDVTLGAA